MKATAYTAEGEARSEQVELPEALFDGTVHEAALHQVVTAIQHNRRQGTASTKDRSTISGGSQKPWRQKGTGRARHGSIRSPIWRGGAVTFGPQPRDFDVRPPKKMKRLAIQSALNARALEGALVLVEPLELEEPRTKTVTGLLDGIGRDDRRVLLLTDGLKRNVYLSARNIPGVEVKPWGQASAYELIRARLIVIEEGAWLGGADEEDEEDEG
jgi:large subunit ribosomal protein L4